MPGVLMLSQDQRSGVAVPRPDDPQPVRFRVLGPLAVQGRDGRAIPVPGTKQRAVLGYLLLHPNQVVATSRLVDALWPGRKPVTARKMVQNAVSALRTALARGNGPDDEVVLLTHAPGYLLRVDPELIDLHRSRRLAEQGRRELAAGSPAAAAESFRQALAQWNGAVLADLVEAGASWPELAAMSEERQAIREDRADAELRCGRHQTVLGELRLLAEADPLNERLCALLMLALHRNGKPVEALELYRRQRDLIAERFDSEPTRELRDLERAVRTRDPAIDPPAPAQTVPPLAPPEEVAADLAADRSAPPAATRTVFRPPPGAPPSALVTEALPSAPVLATPTGEDAPPGHAAGERKRLSAVLVRVEPPAAVGGDDAEAFDIRFREVSAVVAEEAARYGGTVAGRIGSTLLMLFGVFRSRVDDALRAVRAGHAVHDRLLRLALPLGVVPGAGRVRVAVSTGDALVRFTEAGQDAAPMVVGALLDQCLRQLESAEPGHIKLCDATRRAARLVTAGLGDPLDSGSASAAVAALGRSPAAPGARAPLVEREAELDVLTALFNQAVRTGRPHQISVLGEPGVGKTRLVQEFARLVGARAEDAHLLRLRMPVLGRPTGRTALGELVGLCAGLHPADPPHTVDDKLSAALRRWLGPRVVDRETVLGHLRALVAPAHTGGVLDGEAVAACRRMLEALAAERPLVLVLEDLHLADDGVLDFVDGLAESSARIPLLVVTTARPDLIERRPTWGGGGYRTTSTMHLEPLSQDASARLVSRLWEQWGVRHTLDRSDLTSVTGGIPLFVVEYAALFGRPSPAERAEVCGAWPEHLPERVRAVVTEHIDALRPQAKAVLRDASVQGPRFWSEAVAAVGGREVAECERWLAHLERRHFLVRADRSSIPGSDEYVFRSAWVREVTRLSVLQPARREGRRRADAWLAERAAGIR
ncbi:AAA family ATPase [Streptomyces jietaisiensis]|uniref:BTAD domain-containing putative transcriptional regulator n=1 Tax=Streptomyces griseoaurantiacus TaxID=68213 RepID=UPI002E304C6D|nr:BTAD domain-containing putative transcriptional regulator [Streptomyces jietaisiensis]